MLQAEICTIREAAELITYKENLLGGFYLIIYSGSQTAIKCIACKGTRSKMVMSYREALSTTGYDLIGMSKLVAGGFLVTHG